MATFLLFTRADAPTRSCSTPSQNIQDGGHYSADFGFSVRYSGGTLNTTASWTERNAHGSLGAGITLNFADGGSGVVRVEVTSAQDYRCSVSADVVKLRDNALVALGFTDV